MLYIYTINVNMIEAFVIIGVVVYVLCVHCVIILFFPHNLLCTFDALYVQFLSIYIYANLFILYFSNSNLTRDNMVF